MRVLPELTILDRFLYSALQKFFAPKVDRKAVEAWHKR